MNDPERAEVIEARDVTNTQPPADDKAPFSLTTKYTK